METEKLMRAALQRKYDNLENQLITEKKRVFSYSIGISENAENEDPNLQSNDTTLQIFDKNTFYSDGMKADCLKLHFHDNGFTNFPFTIEGFRILGCPQIKD